MKTKTIVPLAVALSFSSVYNQTYMGPDLGINSTIPATNENIGKVCITNETETRYFQEKVAKYIKKLVKRGYSMGNYTLHKDDCYDFITRVLCAVENNSESIDLAELKQMGWNTNKTVGEYGWNKKVKFNRKNPHVIEGDVIFVKNSPFNTGKNHWGVCIFENNETYVIHRANMGIYVDKLSKFIRNCDDCDIALYRNLVQEEVPLVLDFSEYKPLISHSLVNLEVL
ncbi:hypothetical protein KO465_09540 [Candidatus Micrarchaeota archaeon]|nr:hypothetical protein [Candidatus Micrarchaeota archaeon]